MPGLAHHRIIFHAHTAARNELHERLRFAPPHSSLAVWEIVDGARIEGTAPPGAPVELDLLLETSSRARHRYHRVTESDDRGQYLFTVPYPTQDRFSPAIRVLGPYQITSGAIRKRLAISERAVASGGAVAGPSFGAPERPDESR